MLETEEVDDDFFTPVAGEEKSNDSLKYVPPKPQNIPQKQEQTKSTECIFACALIGHEWFNNIYTSRGKLGFAIVKIQKTAIHNIVLYDSNKTTLSCTTVSSNLEITIKNNTYISYYDNLKKYWSVYGTKDEVNKIAEHLSKLDVKIQYSSYTEQGPPEPTKLDIKTDAASEQNEKIDKGSDTDSSINRKTKASILNRMANMGHSVLPTRTLSIERTSDSSDTMETETQPKPVRHKPVKSVPKKSNVDNATEAPLISETHQRTMVPKSDSMANIPFYPASGSQLIPISSTNIITGSNTDLTMFMSEQRISNSELRINMNRITDKVDSVIDKINKFEQRENSNIQTDILMKLLSEYENKIKVYEGLLKSRNLNNTESVTASNLCQNDYQIGILTKKISELERINQDKTNEVSTLQDEIKLLKSHHAEEKNNHENDEAALHQKIHNLESSLQAKDNELTEIHEKFANKTSDKEDSTEEKVKNIMNVTFQTVSSKFDNDEVYSGVLVKQMVGAIIKKITMQTLKDCN
ncbi:hypothetical protein HF086_001177 [Spodoptera exigua]|uniref:FK506-binding protein 15 n=1 Tax=Spodoptera exigua TaxID=7107 RepID=A0A922MCR7_SPOEX|nr:hypothetical protein HF086_001177 [Spodoptera exigua]